MSYLGTKPGNAVVTSEQIADGVVAPNDLSTGHPSWDTSGNVTNTKVISTNDATLSGLTVGKGGGAVSTNTAVGKTALTTNSTGADNTAGGWQAMYNNTTGSSNTAFGSNALVNNTTANGNSAFGYQSLQNNTTGASNTAQGYQALLLNSTASNNTAVGYQAGYTNATGANNYFGGWQAGYLTTSSYNVFIGSQAGYSSTGGYNTCIGGDSGGNFTTGTFNTFVGYGSGGSITTGGKNTIIGRFGGNSGGLDIRTANGYIVLSDGDGNPRQIINGSGNVGIGALPTASKLFVEQGSVADPTFYASNNRSVSGDYAAAFALGGNSNNTSSVFLLCTNPGVANRFIIYGNGTYATVSDNRLKKNIETTRNGYVDDLMKLRVVKYNWNTDEDSTPKELGLIAQEVEEVFPNLIQETEEKELGVKFKHIKTSVIPFMLLKAIQELKAEVDSLKQQLGK